MAWSYSVTEANWSQPTDREACAAVRRTVFLTEQQVPEHEEWDGADANCRHLMATDSSGSPIGTARVVPDGTIGRVAVVASWRGRDVGASLMRAAIELVREAGFEHTTLHAQVQAVPFYERLGYEVYGEPFLEAEIPHRHMRLKLTTSSKS